jgi:hypothetical protein
MDRLHKMVNGDRIELTVEEEAALRAQWEVNAVEMQVKESEQEAEQALMDEALEDMLKACKKECKDILIKKIKGL